VQTVESLYPFARDLVWANSSASIEEIQTLMVSEDVSLMPLLQQEQKVNVALVRRKKIWMWSFHHDGSQPTTKDVKEDPLPLVKLSDPLVNAMNTLEHSSALLLRGDDRKIDRLITPRVVAKALHKYSKGFQAIEELEKRFRSFLQDLPKQDIDEALQASLDTSPKGPKDIEKMTFFEYQTIFSKMWEKFPFRGFNRKLFIKNIDQVRGYRNDLMHFRSTRKDETGLSAAKRLTRLLTDHRKQQD
jgi:hypothetical protein